jgi:hypothetical protein
MLMEIAIVILAAVEVFLAIHPIALHHSHHVGQGISQDVFSARPF